MKKTQWFLFFRDMGSQWYRSGSVSLCAREVNKLFPVTVGKSRVRFAYSRTRFSGARRFEFKTFSPLLRGLGSCAIRPLGGRRWIHMTYPAEMLLTRLLRKSGFYWISAEVR